MELTIIIKGCTSLEEARQALNGPARVVLTAKDLGLDNPQAQPGGETPADAKETGNTQEGGARYRKPRTRHLWKEEEILLAVELNEKKVALDAIADTLETRFGFRVTPEAVEARLRKYGKNA